MPFIMEQKTERTRHSVQARNTAIVLTKPYLNDKNSKIDILKDQEFQKSREVVLSKKKQLAVEGAIGNHCLGMKELSDVEDLLLYFSQFGNVNPAVLPHSLVANDTSL